MNWLVQLLFAQTNRRLNPTSKGLGCYLINIFNDSLVISQTDRHSDGVCGDPLITTDVALYDWLSRRLTELANVYRWMVWYSLIVWLIICCVNVLSDGLIEALHIEAVNGWPSKWVIGYPSDWANECDWCTDGLLHITICGVKDWLINWTERVNVWSDLPSN